MGFLQWICVGGLVTRNPYSYTATSDCVSAEMTMMKGMKYFENKNHLFVSPNQLGYLLLARSISSLVWQN